MRRSPTRVTRRNQTFYFRMAVPRHLTGRIGLREIKLSLRTGDPTTAHLIGRRVSVDLDAFLLRLPHMPDLAPEDIQNIIQDYFRQALRASNELAYLLPRDPKYHREGEIAYLKARIIQLSELAASRSYASVRDDAVALLNANASGAWSPASELFQKLCEGLLRADRENTRILAAKLAGQFDETSPRDPLFAGILVEEMPPPPGEENTPTKVDTLGSVAALFHTQKSKHDWVKKTAADAKRVLSLTEDIIGKDKPIAKLGIEDVKAIRDAISLVPPNYMKSAAGKGINVQDAIKGNADGACLALKTQDKYFTIFRQLLIFARDEGYIEKIPGEGVKIAGATKVNAIDGRLPYSKEQLKAIFASPLFIGHSEKRHEPGPLMIRDGKYWVPLVALYSGMRMGEIIQLLVTDIKHDGDIAYFDVSKGDGKQVKTASSVRRVPVHKVLVKLGLLDLTKNKTGGDRIFHDLGIGTDGYYSQVFSKWWGRYSKTIGFHTDKTAFHSFRHNFKDALQSAEVQEYVAKALMGHANRDVHSQYGSGPSLQILKKNIDKVSYGLH